MVVGFVRGVWQFVQVHVFGGCMICVGVFGFCLVWPLCPFGLPGKRFGLFLWSPVRVGYMRMADGVCGFSCFIRARLSLSISVLRVWFSFCSCLSCWQVWLQQFVVVVVDMVWLVVLWF